MTDPKHTIIDVLLHAVSVAKYQWWEAACECERLVKGSRGLVASEAIFPSSDPYGIDRAAEFEREMGQRYHEVKAAYDYFMTEVGV